MPFSISRGSARRSRYALECLTERMAGTTLPIDLTELAGTSNGGIINFKFLPHEVLSTNEVVKG